MRDDSTLLEDFQSDQPAGALAELFDRYADRVYRLALGLLKDPALAEDVVQETFLAAIAHRAQFQGRANVSTWLFRIAYNACQDRFRLHPEEPLPGEDGDNPDDAHIPLPQALIEWRLAPEEVSADNETRAELERAIASLPYSLQVVFLLRDVEELSTEETAETLGISISAVKVRLHRARLALRERISVYFSERLPE